MIAKIFGILDKNSKIKIILIIFSMILVSILETFGIASIPILVSVFLENDVFLKKLSNYNIFNFLELKQNVLLFFLSFFLVIAFFLKNLLLAFTLFYQFKTLKEITKKNAENLYKIYLNKSYNFFLTINTNILSRNILIENQAVKSTISMFMFLIKEFFVLFGMLIILLYLNWKITVIIVFFISLISLIYLSFFKKKFLTIGKSSQRIRGQQLAYINQTFGTIKEIILSKKQKYILELFKNKNDIYEKDNMTVQFISHMPRLIFEIVAVIALGLFFITLLFFDLDKNQYFGLLSFAGIAFIRIIPSYNLITSSLNKIQFMKPSFKLIEDELSKNVAERKIFNFSPEKFNFNKGHIKIENIKFNYLGSKNNSIENFSARIKIGSVVGIAGPSGSGKSTLINLISGLLEPNSGRILINNLDLQDVKLSWYDLIGYVSQDIFLLDDTIKNNIAFNIHKKKINIKFINKILKVTELTKTINNLEKKIDTVVGERGIRISGGQKQRIGIARALYKKPKILILDEATSSLDNNMEKLIMKNIINYKKKDETIIIIAHRLSSLKDCDEILYIKNGIHYNTFKNYEKFINFEKNVIKN
jgi:ABC-type multidrug transport system fused ATPase/permease subunit